MPSIMRAVSAKLAAEAGEDARLTAAANGVTKIAEVL